MPIHGISKFLKQDTMMHSQLSKYRQASGKNTFKALVENLIRAAIEDCDAYLVTQYLKTGLVNPNDIVCKFKGWRYTALERAAMLRSFDVTKALLDTGANVNKTYSPALQGPLHFSISKTQEGTSVDVQLVNILLENGASFPVELARKALQSCNPGLIRFLMTKLSLLDHCDCWGLLTCVEDLANSELAVMVIVQIVQVCSQSGFPHDNVELEQLARALRSQMSSAARSGDSKLIEIQIDQNANKCPVLTAAVQSAREDLVKCPIGKGTDTVDRLLVELVRAIRREDNELIQYFESLDVLSKIKKSHRFSAIIYAAAKVGNLDCVRKFLHLIPGICGRGMYNALVISIQKGHESIAQILLQAGASLLPSSSPLSRDSHSTPLLEALRRRSKPLSRMIMDYGLISDEPESTWEEAARWGDLSIIKDLASLHANWDSHWGPKAVTAAVKAKKKDLVKLFFFEYKIRLAGHSSRHGLPLVAAIRNQDAEMLQYLLELGAKSQY